MMSSLLLMAMTHTIIYLTVSIYTQYQNQHLMSVLIATWSDIQPYMCL